MNILERLKAAPPAGAMFPASVTNNTALSAIPEEWKKKPSLAQMATNLASSALSAAVHAATTGVVFAPQEIIDNRVTICEKCEFLDKIAYRCAKCGCWMKSKTKLESAHCPVGKW